jgi:hypothetical protein
MTGPLVGSIKENSCAGPVVAVPANPYSNAAYARTPDPPLFPVAQKGALVEVVDFALIILGLL